MPSLNPQADHYSDSAAAAAAAVYSRNNNEISFKGLSVAIPANGLQFTTHHQPQSQLQQQQSQQSQQQQQQQSQQQQQQQPLQSQQLQQMNSIEAQISCVRRFIHGLGAHLPSVTNAIDSLAANYVYQATAADMNCNTLTAAGIGGTAEQQQMNEGGVNFPIEKM